MIEVIFLTNQKRLTVEEREVKVPTRHSGGGRIHYNLCNCTLCHGKGATKSTLSSSDTDETRRYRLVRQTRKAIKEE